MTFNLRYASETPPHTWSARRSVTSECLRQCAPDIIGTQEGFYHALRDIARDRPEYAWIGQGRGGGSRDEFAAIFYKRDRFEPLEFDYFWLSDTPNIVGSNTWGGACVRMATWARFRDLTTGDEFFFCNTHFDHESQTAREKSAALLVQQLNSLKADLPIILTGDFNAPARANRTYDILIQAGFCDAWFAAPERSGKFASFHGYETPVVGAHIDWILTRGAVQSSAARLVEFQQNGQHPSDHFPIAATLELESRSSKR